MKAPTVKILSNSGSLAEETARLFSEIAARAIEARGRFTVALSGGSTPGLLYELLAQAPWRNRVDWSKTHIFWGDERLVPLDDPNNNFRLAHDSLFLKLSPPQQQIHPVPVAEGEPRRVAAAYEAVLRSCFEPPEDRSPDGFPRFDLILLGLGVDGHTASLFPGMPTLQEKERWVVDSPAGRLPPPIHRVTFTLPVLNGSRAVLFLAAGAEKAMIVRHAIEGNTAIPASRVRPSDGDLYWLLDAAAAAELPRH